MLWPLIGIGSPFAIISVSRVLRAGATPAPTPAPTRRQTIAADRAALDHALSPDDMLEHILWPDGTPSPTRPTWADLETVGRWLVQTAQLRRIAGDP